jgi:hypothetical protein
MWKLTKPDLIDTIIDKVLRQPGYIDWLGIRKRLAREGVKISRTALHSRVKKRLHLLIQTKYEK